MSAPASTRYEAAEGIALITLDRPDKRNALDGQTVGEIDAALRRAEEDDSVHVVVLRGEGPDFCAGADLAELERIAAGASPLENLRDAGALGRLLVRMRRMEKPVLAAVHGHALAGGAGLATACDLVLASDDAELGYPEVHLGFVPAMVMALLRRAVGEKVAFELVTRGESIDAHRALELGLVNRVFPRETFDADVRRYALELAAKSPSAVRLIKRLLYGMDGVSFEEAIARGAEVNVLARSTEDTRRGVQKFLERKKGGGR